MTDLNMTSYFCRSSAFIFFFCVQSLSDAYHEAVIQPELAARDRENSPTLFKGNLHTTEPLHDKPVELHC
jgi:hypothetical protein